MFLLHVPRCLSQCATNLQFSHGNCDLISHKNECFHWISDAQGRRGTLCGSVSKMNPPCQGSPCLTVILFLFDISTTRSTVVTPQIYICGLHRPPLSPPDNPWWDSPPPQMSRGWPTRWGEGCFLQTLKSWTTHPLLRFLLMHCRPLPASQCLAAFSLVTTRSNFSPVVWGLVILWCGTPPHVPLPSRQLDLCGQFLVRKQNMEKTLPLPSQNLCFAKTSRVYTWGVWLGGEGIRYIRSAHVWVFEQSTKAQKPILEHPDLYLITSKMEWWVRQHG